MSRNGNTKIMVGQVVGQLAMVAAIPVLTRLISPSEMGIYQTAFSIALVLQPVSTLRLELIIPSSSVNSAYLHRTTARRLSLTLTLLCVVAGVISSLLGAAFFGELIAASGVILLALASVGIENALLIRTGQRSKLAARNFLSGVLTAIVQITAACIFPSAIAIAMALLLGRVLAIVLTLSHVARAEEGKVSAVASTRSVRSTIRAVMSGVISNASAQSVVIAMFGFLGPAAAAQVGVAQRIAGTPTSVLGQGLSQVVLGEAAIHMREGRPGLQRLTRVVMLRTSVAAIVIAATLCFLAPILAVPILGEGWADAGTLTAILAVPLCLQLTAIPVSNLLIPLGYERSLLNIQIIRFVGVLATLVVTAYLGGDLVLVTAATAVTWTLSYIPLLVAADIAARDHDNRFANR